jgi:hypothetical protein
VTESSPILPEPVRFTLQILVIFSCAYLVTLGVEYLFGGPVTLSGVTVEGSLAATLGVVAGWLFLEQRNNRR